MIVFFTVYSLKTYNVNFYYYLFQTEYVLKSKGIQTHLEKSVKHVGLWAYPSTNSVAINHYIETEDISTQTITEEKVINNIFGSPGTVHRDHAYNLQQETIAESNQTCHPSPSVMSTFSNTESDMSLGMDDDITNDPTWKPQQVDLENETEEDDHDISDIEDETPLTDKKYIVFDAQLESLLNRCPNCGSHIIEKKKSLKGSLLTVVMICSESHSTTWQSQPVVNRYPLGNVLLSAACLFAGATYTRIYQIADFYGLQIPDPSTFFRHQKEILFPIISGSWKQEKEKVQQELSNRASGTTVIGDGRCDSPGYSAKYGTYTIMDSTTSKIADFEVVQVSEVSEG